MDHKIIVIGIGPGSPDYLPPIASLAIARASVLVGSARALAAFAPAGSETYTLGKDIAAALAFIAGRLAASDVAVLVSGDPGFYSLLTALRREFGPDRLEVIPGVSSVQLAFARLPPLAGRRPRQPPRPRAGDAPPDYARQKTRLLTDAANAPHAIAAAPRPGWPPAAATWLCADLSYPEENILAADLAAVAAGAGYEHCVMVVMA
jgi:cobalt-precorrin-7 (C5)-methyltransferase